MTALEEFLALEPDSYEGRLNLARVIWEQRGTAEAAPYLEAVIDRDPNALPPLQLLAATTRDADVEDAIERLRAVHRRHPDAWAPLRVLGDLYWRAEDADAALAAYAEAVARGADDDTRAGYLALLGELGRTEELCRAADATPALERRGLAVRWNALRGYLDAERKADAVRLLRTIISDPELSPENRQYCQELLAALTSE
ncbi:MAG: hypothetical protein BWY76_00519 [bacterium ADurb.Bin429]|nr:MAG: hypothetical protein BWY76_00519 [bacterium ADurb.Bin429]